MKVCFNALNECTHFGLKWKGFEESKVLKSKILDKVEKLEIEKIRNNLLILRLRMDIEGKSSNAKYYRKSSDPE